MDDPEDFDSLFREAVAAIDAGDVAALERLLAGHPRLACDRHTSPGPWLRDQIGGALDSFYKDPYLLWFVTEDAPRTGQLSPNVAQITRTILRAAEGTESLPEQLETTMNFAVCSHVGREDGRQLELIDALLEGGASPDHALDALICYNFAAAEHLLRRGAGLTLPVAACTGRLDEVARLGPTATREEKQTALALAAINGKAEGLAALIPLGVDLDDYSTGFYTHATPLHHAVYSGSLDAVKALVEAGAALDPKDKAHGSMPLGWAEYSTKGKPKGDETAKRYAEIAAYLRGKGAQ